MALTSIAITNCNDYNYGSQKEDYCYGNVFVMETLKQDHHSGDVLLMEKSTANFEKLLS